MIASTWRPGLAVNTVPPDPEPVPDPEPIPPPPPDPIPPEPEPFPVPPLEPPPPPQLALKARGRSATAPRSTPAARVSNVALASVADPCKPDRLARRLMSLVRTVAKPS